jgi:glycosyltransferase involved in cell wall biosynthesis
MYRRRDPSRLQVSLVHGGPKQRAYPEVYESQKFLATVTLDGWPTAGSVLAPLSRLEHYRRRVIFVRRAVRWLNKHAAKFDIFHGMGNFSDTLLPALHAVERGLPSCTTVMSLRGELIDQTPWRRTIGYSTRRLNLIAGLDAVVAFSRDIEQRLREGGVPEQRIVYIPNCVDPSRFRSADSSAEKNALKQRYGLGDGPVIAFVGELTERKAPHLIVQALREHARRDWQLIVAGPPNQKSYAQGIIDLVAEQGWKDRVFFLGHIDNVEEVFRVADIYCLPSSDEGMPSALLEAMVSGAACVVAPFSGARELIGDSARGRIVERSVEALSGALGDYLGDGRLRMAHGLAAREFVLGHYTTEKVLAEYMNLFDRLKSGQTLRMD